MHVHSTIRRFLLGAGFLATVLTSVPAQCQLEWMTGSEQSATNGPVQAIVVDSATSNVYVGGRFSLAGSSFVNNVAVWNRSSWAPLGSGVQGAVQDMLLMPNGDLIVAGVIDQAGSQPVANIARWDGTSWSGLGAGFDGVVSSLLLLPNGDLAAAGSFSASGAQALDRLAVWNGTTWLPFAGAGVLGNVYDMELLNNGRLAICGTLILPGVAGVRAVATWDGVAWSGVPLPGAGFAFDLAVLPNGDLAIASPSITNGRFAIWDGTSVQVEATPLTSIVRSMAVDANGDLIAVGNAALQPAMVARRSNGVWTTLLADVGNAASVAVANGQIYIGTTPTNVSRSQPTVQSFDGTSWQVLGSAPNAFVRELVAAPNNTVYAGGKFTEIEGVAANNIAYWNGATWQPLGSGLGGEVLQMEPAPNGDIIVVGRFANAGGAPANRIARWNGSSWSTLGNGPISPTTRDLAVGPSGKIALVTGVGVEVFDAGVWTLLPSPGNTAFGGDCEILPNGDIVVAGSFNPMPGVVRWDGTSWQPVGAAPASGVLALGANGELYRGPPVNFGGSAHIERFDGVAWQSIGGAFNSDINTITVLPGGRVVATGNFTMVGSQAIQRAAIWDGSSWSEIDGGLSPSFAGNLTYDAIATSAGELWLASDYSIVGGEISPRLARAVSTCAATANTFGAGCVGAAGPLSLEATSLPWIGTTVGSNASGFPPGSLALHVLGTAALSAPLPGPGCTLFVDPILVDALVPTQGSVMPTFDVPNNGALVGAIVRSQMVGLELGAGGALQQVTSSNAIDYAIGAF